MPQHVYFDLDGTLTDPHAGITRCILYALDRLGVPHPSDDALLDCIGPPLYETFPKLVGHELTLRAIELYRERFDAIGWLENEPYEGIHETLGTIVAAGYRMFVATAKPHGAARRIVDHFGMAEFFADVYGSELDGTRSDKTDLLRYAEGINGSAESTMIGDRKHDLIAAIASGMKPIGVAYGYGSVDELREAGAVSIANAPADLPSLIIGSRQ